MRRACVIILLVVLGAQATPLAPQRVNAQNRGSHVLTREDKVFIEDLSRRAFQYFIDHADPQTGLVRDRARTDGSPIASENGRDVASIAATGFGLTALCVGVERGWISRGEAGERVRTTLRFFAERAYHKNGWFFHWMNLRTGDRAWNSEVSSIDTALLLGGVLTARQCLREDREVVRLATQIYERIDFRWMLNGHPTFLSHGWYPERGFIPHRWRDYSEHMILILLAVGSPTHPITPTAWRAFARKWITYGGYHYINAHPPLFIHQYSHAWVDFRGRREGWYPFVNYFENSVKATRAHRQFCIDLSKEFPAYGPDVWGISASDSERGYLAWGGPPRDPAIDGTVVPYAPAGSLMFTPDISLSALRTLKEKYGEKTYGRYGFADAFNPNTGWVDTDVIGIDQGITLIGAENLRDGLVWHHFMKNREITRALDLVGLKRTR